jgi:DNA mismatch repair protein MutS2
MGTPSLMDAHTLELLEFGKVRELLAGYCATSLGKELARQIEPDTDADAIRARIGLVSEMVDALGRGQAPPFGGVHDVRLLVRRAAIGSMLTAEQLLEVADTLTATGAVYRYRMRLSEHCQRLMAFLGPIEDLGAAAKLVTGCIDSRGHVLDMASPELGQVRRRLADVDERVQLQIKRLLRDPQLRSILRYPNATVSGDHYVLPVAVNFRHKLPGVVHRTSSTGETLFIEPAGVASLSASRAVLKSDEDREIRRVLRRLSADVGRLAQPLTRAIDVLAELDVITAKARYSRDYHMMPPDINIEGKLWLRQGRHPLLEHLFRQAERQGDKETGRQGDKETGRQGDKETEETPGGAGADISLSPGLPVFVSGSAPAREVSSKREVVPIDVRLGHAFNLLVITGPNTGGKTVSLKTTGLLCLMAQSGMHIPAGEGSQVPVFSQVLADIGDEQSLEQSLSTFSSHISRIAGILRSADACSLVLLDELGAGTDPTEGAALGRAILDSLDQIGCRAMVTTHLGDLKTYAFANERAENAAVEFDVETLRPTYRLQIGQFGASNALQIARRLKLPRDLLKRAHRYLRRKQRRAPELAQLQQLREEAEKARADALAAQHDATKKRDEYVQRAEKLQRDAEAAARLRDWRAKLQAGDTAYVERFGKPGKVVRIDHKKGVAVVSVGLGQWEVPLEEVLPVETP